MSKCRTWPLPVLVTAASCLISTARVFAGYKAFPITRKWPALHSDRIQLYSLPTPHGVKVSIMLEETGLPYEPYLVVFATNDQTSPAFLSLNPNNKIPVILDPNGRDGKPPSLFESGAILINLAGITGKFMPQDAAGRYETMQWIMKLSLSVCSTIALSPSMDFLKSTGT